MIAEPAGAKAEVRLDEAKHFIDTIEMLQAKTEGNRTAEETAAIEQVLHELRLGYVGREPTLTSGASSQEGQSAFSLRRKSRTVHAFRFVGREPTQKKSMPGPASKGWANPWPTSALSLLTCIPAG